MNKSDLDAYQISELITKYLTENISEEDLGMLNAWRNSSSENETCFQGAVDREKVASEYRAIGECDSYAALQDMKARIAKSKNKKRVVSTLTAAASVAAAVVLYILISPSADMPQVSTSPENTIAQLITSDGEIKQLSGKDHVVQYLESGSMIINSDTIKVSAQNEFNEITLPFGQRSQIELSDGSKVWLNAGSSLRFPVDFRADKRTVELSGEAYFRVSKDTSRPFIVRSNDKSVEVLGTAFNISSYLDDNIFIATLVEGVVTVETPNSEKSTLRPNQQYKECGKSGKIEIKDVDARDFIAWIGDEIVLDNISLRMLLKKLERQYNVQFIFEESPKCSMQLTGRLHLEDNIDKVMESIAKITEIKYKVQGNIITINN